MTTIGSTTYSYITYTGLTRGKSEAHTPTAGDKATTRNSALSPMGEIKKGPDDTGSTKLSSALWDLASAGTHSARDEAVWQDAGESRTKAEKEFGDLAEMTIAELIRAKYLEDNDLTEGDLARMPAKEREAIEAEIREAVEQVLDNKAENEADTIGSGAT